MKRGYLFAALLFAVFMFPFIGSVSNADALGNYQCGNPDRKTHVNCLRAKLDSTPFGLTVPKGKRGLGKYGCGTKKRRKHVNCLRSLLDQHGPFLAKGATGQVPPSEINLCLASLKEIDERTFRNCKRAEEEIDTLRGGVCKNGVMWHNPYEDSNIKDVNDCKNAVIKTEDDGEVCSSALSRLKGRMEVFNEPYQGWLYPTAGQNSNGTSRSAKWVSKMQCTIDPHMCNREGEHQDSEALKSHDKRTYYGQEDYYQTVMHRKKWYSPSKVQTLNAKWEDAKGACGF